MMYKYVIWNAQSIIMFSLLAVNILTIQILLCLWVQRALRRTQSGTRNIEILPYAR